MAKKDDILQDLPDQPDQPEVEEPNTLGDKILVSKKEWDDTRGQIQTLAQMIQEMRDPTNKQTIINKGFNQWETINQKPMTRTATLPIFRDNTEEDWKIAVDRKPFKKVGEGKNLEQIYKITLRDKKGKQTTIEMPILKYARTRDQIIVTIIEQKSDLKRLETGETRKIDYDYDNFKRNEGGVVKMYVVEEKNRESLVFTPEYGEFWVPTDILNNS